MERNKAKEFKTIQLITGKNMGAVNILCACADKGRFDIVETIWKINKQDAINAITPEMITKVFKEKCNSDIDAFISLIDKQLGIAKEINHRYS